MSPHRLVPLGLLLLGACADSAGGGGRAEGPRGPLPFVPAPLAAAGAPSATPDAAPAPGAVLRDRGDVVVACREAADRVIVTRDRGQLLREDERDARVGSQASIYAQRSETDRLGRIFERDRLARECVGQNARGGSAATATGASPPR